jgi:predicted ATP-dependent serine protease
MSEAYTDIEAVPMDWLIPDFIPVGTVTLMAGPGGCGKGMACIYIAAKVSQVASVVMVTSEDDLQSTVAYRLRAAGANLANVHDLTFDDDGNPFTLPGMIGTLRETVDQIGDVALIVIDPLMACVETSIASNLGARKVIAPLQRLAAETHSAVILTHHTVKSGAVAGSKGLTDACRIVYTIAPDRENPAVKVMRSAKANITNGEGCRRYTIQGKGNDAVVHFITAGEQRRKRLFRRSA